MGLSDQISRQSPIFGDSFSHRCMHVWILLAHTSAVMHILVIQVTTLWLVFWGWWGFWCLVEGFFVYSFVWRVLWVFFFFISKLTNFGTLLTHGANKLCNCPSCSKPSSPYAQQCTFWKLAQIPQNVLVGCSNIPAPASVEIIRSHLPGLQQAENEASNLLCEAFVKAYHNELPCGASKSYSRRWLGQQEAEIASFSCRMEASCSYLEQQGDLVLWHCSASPF